MKLSVIIVNFNVEKLLKACLKSLEKEAKKDKNLKIEIIVVDNDSKDNSVKMIKESFAEIKLIVNKSNSGFARASNQGIKVANGNYLLLLNPDTVVKPGALKTMVDFAQTHPLAGVVGGKLFDPDGQIQGSCYYLPTVSRAFKQLFTKDERVFRKFIPKGEGPTEVEAVTGSTFFVPKSVIEKVGLLNEDYFMYFEDLDYCRE